MATHLRRPFFRDSVLANENPRGRVTFESKVIFCLIIQVPYEVINKKFRLAQKTLDREVSQVQNAATEMEKCLKPGASVGEIRKLLGGVVERLQVLKRKANESISDELSASYVCKRRLEHLKESAASEQPSNFEVWQANIDNWKRVSASRSFLLEVLWIYFQVDGKP